jgi:NAD-dependent DNA ligase
VCGSEAVAEEGEVDVRCTGGLICRRPAHAAAANISSAARRSILTGLGSKTIAQFFELGWLESPADIFRLKGPPRRDPGAGRVAGQVCGQSVGKLWKASARPMLRGCCSASASAMSAK